MQKEVISSLSVALSFFLNKKISPLKLQKLLYYTQVWCFVKHERLFFADHMQAWAYGPVIPKVWTQFRFVRRTSPIYHNPYSHVTIPNSEHNFLSLVWNAYGHLSDSALVDLTHTEKPWNSARGSSPDMAPGNARIVIDKATTAGFHLDVLSLIPIQKEGDPIGYIKS